MTTATVTVTVTSDGCAVVELDGQPPQQFQADDLSQARHQAVELVIAYARHIGQPIALHARDSDASHLLEIHPDGTMRHTGTAPPARQESGSAPRILACPPTAGRQRRRWPLVAAPPRPPTPAPVAIDAGTLGVTTAARSASPRPVPLPVAVAPVAWNSAATWQQRRLRQASWPVTTWTAAPSAQVAPVPEASGISTAPTSRAPAAAPPTRPQVIINPDPAAAAPRRAPKQPAGPAMPD